MNAPEEMLFQQAGSLLQQGTDGLAISVFDGHGDQVCGPVRPDPACLDDGLHPTQQGVAAIVKDILPKVG